MNALNAYNRLNANVAGMKKASEKLSSGYRINRAGDDAAGLAISEKMRSQIKGLNQAVRNSQDGINMIQTFEGAAQETHSILQRMKELAVESANGTYDNATDRAAIQLEFEQLNDELNQIADTDFNGTIVLNGGEMADGLKANIDETTGIGEFNYKDAYDAAQAGTATTAEPKDVVGNYTKSEGGTETAHQILDNTKYGQAEAKALWKELGIDPAKYDEVNITFVRDDSGKWSGAVVTDSEGKIIKGANANVKTTVQTANGGFSVDSANVNAIFNELQDDAVAGDYITLNFKGLSGSDNLPTNAGIDEVKYTSDGTHEVDLNLTGAQAADVNVTMPEFTLGEFDKMTADLKTALDELNAATINAAIADNAGDAEITFTATGFTFTDDGEGGFTVTHDGTGLDLGTLKGGNVAPKADTITTDYTALDVANDVWTDGTTLAGAPSATLSWGGGAGSVTGAGVGTEVAWAKGDKVTVAGDKITAATVGGVTRTVDAASASTTGIDDGTYYFDGTDWYLTNGKADIYTAAGATAGDGSDIDTAIGAATDGGKVSVDTAADDFVDGATFDFGVNVDGYSIATGEVEAHAVATEDTLGDDAMAALEAAASAASVTKANAFDNSTAILTYTNNITLQTGARTKDAVNFSFAYNTDGTADMGDLKANLNLSARADGLNTANLSLANQKDANYAIDQIDKAINKTSMVRATFGAIQNRLEHKITNLTTSAENLTEAESSIRDTDMASEMMNYTKFNILQQAAQSMLAQANQQPQSILQLLG